jgi:hypothetical protein
MMQPFNTRPICFRCWSTVEVEQDGRGNILLRSPVPLPPYKRRLDDMVQHAAAAFLERVFSAERDVQGWRKRTDIRPS